MTIYQSSGVAKNNPTPGAITDNSITGGASGAGNGAGNSGGANPFNPSGLTKEQYIAMTPAERNAYDSRNAANLVSQGIISPSMGASIQSTISGGLDRQMANQNGMNLQTFEQSQGQSQTQFLNKISPAQVQSQAYASDQAQMAAALGLGTNQVPASVYSEYAKTQGFRETRAAQVAKGAKGTDVSYPTGVKSPLYSENVSTAMTKGGSVFIGGVGAYEFKAPATPTKMTEAPKEQHTSQMTQAQMNHLQTSKEFQAANAPGVVGGMSLASGGWMTLREGKPPPSVRSTPTFDTRIQESVMNVGATSEQWFAPIRGAVEGFFAPSVKAYGAVPIIGDAAKVGYSLGTLPEAMLVKVPAAAVGVGSMIGYRIGTGTFGTPLPYEKEVVSEVVKTATNPAFLVTTVALAGLARGGATGEIMPVEFAKITVSEAPKSGYVGIGVMGKPIIGAKIVGGEGSLQIGMPKFTSEPTAYPLAGKSARVNVADVMNPTEAAVYRSNILRYAETSRQPAIAERYVATEAAAKFAYKSELPFEKGIATVKEIPAIKELPVQAQENLVGYVTSQKGSIQQVYGSFNADVRGALPRAIGDLDIQLKGASMFGKAPTAAEFGKGAITAIESGGGKAQMVGSVLNVLTKKGYAKAIDIHDVVISPATAKPVGTGGGIGFGLRPKMPVAKEGIPYMASGEQAARVGSSISVMREVGGRRFLSPSEANLKRTGDFIAIVEKTAQVKGNTQYSQFGKGFVRLLNPYEKAYFRANPDVASKVNIKLFESPSGKSSMGASPSFYSMGGSVSISASPSRSISPSFSVSPSVSPSRSPSRSISPSFSVSPSVSPSRSPSRSPSVSPSMSVSPSVSPSRSPSRSVSGSISGYSPSPSRSPSPSFSPSSSISPSPSRSPSPSISPSFSISPNMSGISGFGKKKKKEKGKYSPSFIAVSLGIRATKAEARRSERTGFAIRGIVGPMGKKKRNTFSIWE